MSKPTPTERAAFAALDRIYARLPAIACQGKCAQACGAIPVTELEARRLHVTTHRKPRTLPMVRADGTPAERCTYLTDAGRCAAYAVRPLICRAWGIVVSLSCPFGCRPEREIGTLEYLELARAVEILGGGRVIRTTPAGLVAVAGESYASIPIRNDPATIARNDARTRTLRALHGGFILAAVEEDPT